MKRLPLAPTQINMLHGTKQLFRKIMHKYYLNIVYFQRNSVEIFRCRKKNHNQILHTDQGPLGHKYKSIPCEIYKQCVMRM